MYSERENKDLVISLLLCIYVDIRIPLEWKEFEQQKGKIGELLYLHVPNC